MVKNRLAERFKKAMGLKKERISQSDSLRLKAEAINKINSLLGQVTKKRELLKQEAEKAADSQRSLRVLIRLIRENNFSAAKARIDDIQRTVVAPEEEEELEIAEIGVLENRELLEIQSILKNLSS